MSIRALPYTSLNTRPVRIDNPPKPLFMDPAMEGKVSYAERNGETLNLAARVHITAGENIEKTDYIIETEGFTRSKHGFFAEGAPIGGHNPAPNPKEITEKGILDFTQLAVDGIKQENIDQLSNGEVVMENRYSTVIMRMPLENKRLKQILDFNLDDVERECSACTENPGSERAHPVGQSLDNCNYEQRQLNHITEKANEVGLEVIGKLETCQQVRYNKENNTFNLQKGFADSKGSIILCWPGVRV